MSDPAPVAVLTLSLSGSDPVMSTRPDYRHTTSSDILTTAKFHEVTNLLLENPNLNSSHLFRADILHDSAGELKTKAQHDALLPATCSHDVNKVQREESATGHGSIPALNGLQPHRTVIRRLVPRNQNLDRPLEQSCFFYRLDDGRHVVAYIPHVEVEEQMPWYHPKVKALAYVFEPGGEGGESTISLWSVPFRETNVENGEMHQRLHRTLLALGSTFLRLAKYQGHSVNPATSKATSNRNSKSAGDLDLRPSAIKDTIIPQHTVQDTYARLKTQYAQHLIATWVEATPPDKHVFEDLAIAAFLLCLWEKMYGSPSNFTGFVDIACGNGLLVYILNNEGWAGWGLDARRRKTWDALGIDDKVIEKIIVPKPFLDLLDTDANNEDEAYLQVTGTQFHNGIFKPGTFIIANHADELTAWTPLLSALSSPTSPLPFLNIPCCSHALSGEKHRYTPNEASLDAVTDTANGATPNPAADDHHAEEQSSQGDLKALRAKRTNERAGTDDKSMYACLTRKAVQLSRQLRIATTCTLMRIPSTRNVGIVNFSLLPSPPEDTTSGGMSVNAESGSETKTGRGEWRARKAMELVERECARTGGVRRSAEVWVDRARRLHGGQGRGKVNWGGKFKSPETRRANVEEEAEVGKMATPASSSDGDGEDSGLRAAVGDLSLGGDSQT